MIYFNLESWYYFDEATIHQESFLTCQDRDIFKLLRPRLIEAEEFSACGDRDSSTLSKIEVEDSFTIL